MRNLALAASLVLLVSCAREENDVAPRRRCGLVVWHRVSPARSARVEVATGWDRWLGTRPLTRAPGEAGAAGWYVASLAAPAGEQRYAILEDGEWKLDENVATTAFETIAGVEREVTLAFVDRCDEPGLAVERVSATRATATRTTIEARLTSAADGARLDPATIRVLDRVGAAIAAEVSADPASGAIRIAATLPGHKNRVTIVAADARGRSARTEATVWNEPEPWSWSDATIYQIVVDRYRDAAGRNVPPPPRPAARAGGDLDGVRTAIEDGTLEALGVNAIWISPPNEGPSGAWPGEGDKTYENYHGYWPVAARRVEPLFGGERALDALVAAAHARGIRVIADVVPNHVHIDHPYVEAHAGEGWFHGRSTGPRRFDDYCVCGAQTCGWSPSCWFTPYLPDLDWRNAAAARQTTDDVLWWIDRFDLDGIRVDAVPLMPRSASRLLADRVRARFDHPGAQTYVLGEVFTGPGEHGAIRWFLGPQGIDAAFDFPLMWSLRDVLGTGRSTMRALAATIETSARAFEGSRGPIATILGNHDVPRFVSAATFDTARDGFEAAPQPDDPDVYARLGLAFGVLFALPGAPTIYYGDEIGLAGSGDPDTRRVLPEDDALSPARRALRAEVAALGQARACSETLRRGALAIVHVDDERLVLSRRSPGRPPVVIVITRGALAESEIAIDAPEGEYRDLLVEGTSATRKTIARGRLRLDEPPRSVRIYAQEDCRAAPRTDATSGRTDGS